MFEVIPYHFHRLINRALADFVDMGYGIEARFRRSAKFWRPHLELSRGFQGRALESLKEGGGRAAVLGAGGLHDINTALLKNKFSRVDLYDANRAVLRRWKRVFRGREGEASAGFHICDLTGSLADWTAKLEAFAAAGREEGLSAPGDFLRGLAPCEPGPPVQPADVVFSVNLLSQLPIYWRDRVHRILSRRWKLETDDNGNYGHPLQAGLEASMAALQRQHIKMISSMQPALVIMIYDRCFMYYRKDTAPWQEERSLFIDEADAAPRGYRCVMQDGWFWHIAPQGIESPDYGSIHDVSAKAFVKGE